MTAITGRSWMRTRAFYGQLRSEFRLLRLKLPCFPAVVYSGNKSGCVPLPEGPDKDRMEIGWYQCPSGQTGGPRGARARDGPTLSSPQTPHDERLEGGFECVRAKGNKDRPFGRVRRARIVIGGKSLVRSYLQEKYAWEVDSGRHNIAVPYNPSLCLITYGTRTRETPRRSNRRNEDNIVFLPPP